MIKKIKIFLFLFSLFLSTSVFSQSWSIFFGDTLFSNVPEVNYAIEITYLNTFKNKLLVHGSFKRAGNLPLQNIAQWHNFTWDNMGLPLFSTSNIISCSVIHNNKLYVGGNFWDEFNDMHKAYGVVYYDGNQWYNTDTNAVVHNGAWLYDLFWKNNNLYTCGSFWELYYLPYGHVASWDGQQWNKLKNGIMYDNPTVYAIAEYNNDLYFAGWGISQIDTSIIYGIGRWDGSNWYSVGQGLGEQIKTLLTDTVNNRLYAGGQIYNIEDTIQYSFLQGVCYWDGLHWHSMGEMDGGLVEKIVLYRGNLYAGGWFHYMGDSHTPGIAKWNGTNWESPAQGMMDSSDVHTMCVYNDELIVGGIFKFVGDTNLHGLARYYEPPDSACLYFNPAIYTDKDTFYLTTDTGKVQFYSNSLHGSSWLWNFADTFTDTARMPKHTYADTGTYAVSLTITEAHCTKTVTKNIVILDTATSVEEQQKTFAGLKIYPNPANNNITIETILQANETGQLKITNSRGKQQTLLSVKGSKNTININTSTWAKGIYLCSLHISGKTVKVEKLVIE